MKALRFIGSVILVAIIALGVRAAVKAVIGKPPQVEIKQPFEIPEDSPIKIADKAVGNRLERSYIFTDQDGNEFDLAAWYDKPMVVSFIFTNCPEICPAITTSLSRIVRDNKDRLGEDFRVVSISFDTKNDTVEALRDYGMGFTQDFDNWKFLTGSPETIKNLADRMGIVFRPSNGAWEHTVGVTIVAPTGYVFAQVFGPTYSEKQILGPVYRSMDREYRPSEPSVPKGGEVER